MGCGGSKASDVDSTIKKSPRKVQATKTSRLDGKPYIDPSTPRQTSTVSKKDRRGGDATKIRKPPKGVRRNSVTQGVPPVAHYAPPVPYEAEHIAMEGNWEVEKGVDHDTLITDNSYPPPKPGKPVSDKVNYNSIDYEIMKNNDMRLAAGTFEEVATKLTTDIQVWDIIKVRALTTWMGSQKIRTRQYGNDAKPGTVLWYMKKIQESNGTFAGLLTQLCRAIDIPCVIVKGFYKSSCHQVGEDDLRDSRCTWNAVHVDGSWQLVHPFLVCTPLSATTTTNGWKQIESSKVDSSGEHGFILNAFFFAPKPSEFIYCCIPDESNSLWQLLDTKCQYTNFLKLPFLRPAFFSNNMKLKSEDNCVLKSEGGKCIIQMQCDASIPETTDVVYQLFALDPDLDLSEDLGNIVICGRNEDIWNVQVKFPVQGTFKLSLYGDMHNWTFWLGDFKIECDVPIAKYVPQPQVPKDVGWGPSKLAEASGLLAASHEGGIVFYKPKEEHVIKFLVNEKIKTKCELENTEMDKESLQKYCKMVNKKCEIDFAVNLPISGEFALRIYKIDENGEESNVCNYLFMDSHHIRKREDVFQRKARWKLREATVGHDVVALESTLHKFSSVKLEEDDDFLRGKRRQNYLKLKRGLRDGRMRRHEQTLAQAINEAEHSQFKLALQPNIDKARAMLDSIRSLEMHTHPVLGMDQKTIDEIASFSNPPQDVHETMTATYLLLGEDMKSLKKWGYIQGLLRRHGKESIKHRVDRFHHNEDPAPDKATIKLVQQVHDSVPKPYILSASLSATTFYNWVSGVLAYHTNCSQNATDDTYETDTIMTNNAIMYESPDEIIDGYDEVIDDYDEVIDGYDKVEEADENSSQDEGFLDSQDVETNAIHILDTF